MVSTSFSGGAYVPAYSLEMGLGMTREEAIAELKCSIELTHFDPHTGETSEWLNEEDQRYVDACNMAIKALERSDINVTICL